MMQKIDNELISRLVGLNVSMYDDAFLNKSVQKRMTDTQSDSSGAYSNLLEQSKEEVTKLVDSLHISYSEFFRNSLTYSVLERIILPSLVQRKKTSGNKQLRIWSAASAAGQEAYSLAMLLEEFNSTYDEKLNYRIFATDQCDVQVNLARQGIYSADALNNLNRRRVKQWFTKQGDSYLVKPELKEHIDYSVFDLFSEQLSTPPASIFGDFDLVVCANLLFYYKPQFQEIIIGKAGSCLADKAYLVVGETERDILRRHNFNEVFPQSGIFQIL